MHYYNITKVQGGNVVLFYSLIQKLERKGSLFRFFISFLVQCQRWQFWYICYLIETWTRNSQTKARFVLCFKLRNTLKDKRKNKSVLSVGSSLNTHCYSHSFIVLFLVIYEYVRRTTQNGIFIIYFTIEFSSFNFFLTQAMFSYTGRYRKQILREPEVLKEKEGTSTCHQRNSYFYVPSFPVKLYSPANWLQK